MPYQVARMDAQTDAWKTELHRDNEVYILITIVVMVSLNKRTCNVCIRSQTGKTNVLIDEVSVA